MLKLKSVNFERQQFQTHQLERSRTGDLEWVIGRSSGCDLVLPNSEVSRVHGRIIYTDGAYHFIDEGSTSGSLLNGEVVPANEQRSLRLGDLLQIGETFLYVEELASPTVDGVELAASFFPPFVVPQQMWTDQDLLCRCCRIVDETPDVKTFYFISEPPVLFNYQPGQFVNLEVEIEGQAVIRSYSISSSPTRPYHLSLTVKRVPSPAEQPDVPPGLVSNWLHNHLKVGDRLKLLGGPLGHFTCLPDLPSKLLLISAGSGITPMMSMSRWVQDALTDCDIVFLHSARTPEDIVFRAELEAMSAQMPNFHLAVTLTRQPVGRSWMGLTGRISESMLQLVAPDLFDRAVFVCGPDGFMQGIRSMLADMKFPMQNYQEESFGGAKKPKSAPAKVSAETQPKPVPATSHNNASSNSNSSSNGNGNGRSAQADPVPAVHFVQSDRLVPADGTTSILELAEQEGIKIRHACRVGACGACKVHTRQGQVRYDTPPSALSTKDEQAGYVLACVAYPVNQVAIEA
jgi:ferredoxin-NADP reductase/ferredoxin